MRTLKLAIKERMMLYECYMPFIENGGLFVPLARDAAIAELILGEDVRLSLELMHEPEPFQTRGRVVWITPPGAQGDRAAGAGIGFDIDSGPIRAKIENWLAGAAASQRRTHTL